MNGRGFTLLEILVALAMVALVLGSALLVLSSRTDQQIRLEQADQARWVAANVLASVRSETAWPGLGQRRGEMTMGRVPFHWRLDVLETDVDGVRRLEVRVFADREQGQQRVLLTTLVARP